MLSLRIYSARTISSRNLTIEQMFYTEQGALTIITLFRIVIMKSSSAG